MNRLLASVALVALLMFPNVVSASSPDPGSTGAIAVGGAWEIASIQTLDNRIQITGKLAIGSDLQASVGCNSMTAPVLSFDGTTLTIGDIATTLIGCPPEMSQAEMMLAAVLGAGALTFDGSSLTSSGGRISFVFNDPVEPIATPPANDLPAVDAETCATLLGPEWDLPTTPGTTPGDAGGSTSGSSGGSTPGSGGGTSGSGSGPSGTVSPPIEIAPAPPGGPEPGATAGPDKPPVDLPLGVPVPDLPPVPADEPSANSNPSSAVASPPSPISPPSTADLCRDLLARLKDQTVTSEPGGVDSFGAGKPLVGASPEAASDVRSAGSDIVLWALGGAALGLVVGLAAGWRLWVGRRRGIAPAADDPNSD